MTAPVDEQIIRTSVVEEMNNSFLEYAYSVIMSRALPDIRDGLKPVHRRILFGAHALGVRPDKSTVKCARVVGEVMGNLHPHGDAAIYDALIHMAQPWYLRVPMIEPQGNIGSLDDGPAAMRYVECRINNAAMAMLDEMHEDTVDFRPNYDGKTLEPSVLPAAYPNLIVNGGEGIAVGMATKMAPHNLVETVAALKAMIADPAITLEQLMVHLPGPDLPSGGAIVGLDGVRDAYRTGRGTFTMRATATVGDITARRRGITITELPYQVGPEKVIGQIKDLVNLKKLDGISDVKDLSDMKNGLRLIIECKVGFNPHAVLDELYRKTSLQTQYSVNNVCLVNGVPRTVTMLEMCRHFLDHRMEVVTRRTRFRLRKAQDRAHIVEGLLKALASIEEVVRTIRESKDTATARTNLCERFELTEVQAEAILAMTLRQLTGLEVERLERELAELRSRIAELEALLASESDRWNLIAVELDEIARKLGTPRRTRLLDGEAALKAAAGEPELEVADEPCVVTLTTSGLLGRAADKHTGSITRHDALISSVATTTRSTLWAVSNRGRLHRVNVVELPAIAGRARGAAVSELVAVDPGERIVAVVPLVQDRDLVLVTAGGVLKRTSLEAPNKNAVDIIGLKDGDTVVFAGLAQPCDGGHVVMVTSDGQLLRVDLAGVRAQGRTAGGVAGIRLAKDAVVVGGGLLEAETPEGATVTVLGETGLVKVSAAADYPVKGRGTGGVRCYRFGRGEEKLTAAAIGIGLPVCVTADGKAALPAGLLGKRDGAGVMVGEAETQQIGAPRR